MALETARKHPATLRAPKLTLAQTQPKAGSAQSWNLLSPPTRWCRGRIRRVLASSHRHQRAVRVAVLRRATYANAVQWLVAVLRGQRANGLDVVQRTVNGGPLRSTVQPAK